MCSARSRITDLTVAAENAAASFVGLGAVVATLQHWLARLTAEEQEADHGLHAGQLNWQQAQDYFHDCHPEHNTPKHRFGAHYYNNILRRTI
jgi:hypothetical protein